MFFLKILNCSAGSHFVLCPRYHAYMDMLVREAGSPQFTEQSHVSSCSSLHPASGSCALVSAGSPLPGSMSSVSYPGGCLSSVRPGPRLWRCIADLPQQSRGPIPGGSTGPLVASWPYLPSCTGMGCLCSLPSWTGGSTRAGMTIYWALQPQCPARCLDADEWSL